MRLKETSKVLVVAATNEFLKNSKLVHTNKTKNFDCLIGNAAIVSDRLIDDDIFTSVVVEQFETVIPRRRNLTRKIVGVSEKKLEKLDEEGIIKVGAIVNPKDILVGIGETRYGLTPEERLLDNIFGNNLSNCSLYYNFNDKGIVTDCQKLQSGYHIKVDVLIKRKLQIGDILKNTIDKSIIIAQIMPDYMMPVFNEKRVDVLVSESSEICQCLFRHSPLFAPYLDSKKVFGTAIGEKMALKKIPLYQEDKIQSYGFSCYNVFSINPSGGVKTKRETIEALFKNGYTANLREIFSLKSGGRKNQRSVFNNLHNGEALDLKKFATPRITNNFLSLLKSVCLNPYFLDSDGKEVEDLTTGKAVKLILRPATPREIRHQTYGEVTLDETVDYKTSELRPIPNGLFCQKIFGPVKDWQCACGKYIGSNHKGIVCERCCVEVTSSKERRKRMGNIELSYPVIHPWSLRHLANALEISQEKLERIIDFKDSLGSNKGPEAIEQQLIESGIPTNAFVLRVLPVLPPELRAIIRTKEDAIVASDLNYLYTKVIRSNNDLKKLSNLGVDSSVIEKKRKILQKAVNCLFSNHSLSEPKRKRYRKGRYLCELALSLDGISDQMFNRRVDYSATGITIPDINLAKKKIGIPLNVALEIFKPTIFHNLIEAKVAVNSTTAQSIINHLPKSPQVLEAVKKALKNPVLVITPDNQIQALAPVITEGEVIRLNPQTGEELKLKFGEEIAIHVPLSEEAKKELDSQPNPIEESAKTTFFGGFKIKQMVEFSPTEVAIELGTLDKLALGI